jgi:hypothetical protein
LVQLSSILSPQVNNTNNNNESSLSFPTTLTPVLAPWNPHLIILALSSLQCLFALARVNARYSAQQQAHPIPISGAGVVLSIILLAASILQGVHSSDLVHYPTMLVVAGLWFYGLWFVVSSHGLSPVTLFHDYTRTVSIPTAVIAGMVFGSRMWADALSHWVLLQIAATVGWCLLMSSGGVLKRTVVAAFVLMPTLVVVSSTGRDDQWRYASILVSSVGLLPLLAMSTVGFAQTTPPRTIAGLVLIANNAALLSIIAVLANF